MNRVVHFEIQADNVNRVKKFYENVLGWKITQWMKKEDGGMDYWGIETGKNDPGDKWPGINGGLYKRDEAENKLYTYDCTITVADIDTTIESIKQNGGTITKEKSEIPGVGLFAGAMDTEGNRFGIMQSK